MCGIVGVIGTDHTAPSIALAALKRLEYRGYDGAGIAVADNGELHSCKAQGKMKELQKKFDADPLCGTRAIAHTRWATHGNPTELNCHPHFSNNGRIGVVHNGIIENFREKRDELRGRGYTFHSETDTEVLPNLIDYKLHCGANSLPQAVEQALKEVTGTYAIAVIAADYPELVGARRSAPLAVGINGALLFLASDTLALAGLADHVIHLNDGDVVTLNNDKTWTFNERPGADDPIPEEFTTRPEEVERGEHGSFMLKEILEQPNALRDATSSRIGTDGLVKLEGIREVDERIRDSDHIYFVACGTSLYASMAGKLLIESLPRIRSSAELASEFQYSNPILDSHDTVIAVSQSGATAETLQAARVAKQGSALVLGINNRVGSTLSRETGIGIYLHAGPEMGVASTKAFTAQVSVLALLAVRLAQMRRLEGSEKRIAAIVEGLRRMPALIDEALTVNPQIQEISRRYKDAKSVFCLGRGFAVPLAYEGALKLKEIGYLNAEGYPGGELKHGPLALIEPGVPVFSILCEGDGLEEKMLSNMQEVKARGGDVIAIVSGRVNIPEELTTEVIQLPQVPPELICIIGAIPFQLLAYHVATEKGYDVDQPRNLAKSVTVE